MSTKSNKSLENIWAAPLSYNEGIVSLEKTRENCRRKSQHQIADNFKTAVILFDTLTLISEWLHLSFELCKVYKFLAT